MIASTSNSNYRIYSRTLHQWLNVSEEIYLDHTRFYGAFRKRTQSHGQCCCPRSKAWLCDGDCLTCEFRTVGKQLSLDYTAEDRNGKPRHPIDDLPDETVNIPCAAEKYELKKALYEVIGRLEPENQLICQRIMEGKSEREIAAELGISRSTYTYRRDKLFQVLRKQLATYM